MLSPFQYDRESPAEDRGRESDSDYDPPSLGNSTLVCQSPPPDSGSSNITSQQTKHSDSPSELIQSPRIPYQTQTDSVFAIRGFLEARGFSTDSASIIDQAWRKSTKQQYSLYIRKWFQFCDRKQTSALQGSVNVILDFLTSLYNEGSSYSAINTAKAAVMMFMSLALGKNFDSEAILVSKFMKGVFALRPSLPKYGVTWDVSVVLDHLDTLCPPTLYHFCS